MQIDWVTLAAQVVNFVVLIWLLRLFLFRPIADAMRRREQHIEDRLAQAAEEKERAEKEAEAWREKQAELEAKREEMLDAARGDAEELRSELEQKARDETARQSRAWRREVLNEREEFMRELQVRAVRHFYDLARSALGDLADADLEAQAAARFIAQLEGLDGARLKKITEAAQAAEGGVRIESSFALPPAAKAQVTKGLHELIGKDLPVSYGQSEDLLLGVRLVAGSQSVEWSLARRLQQLQSAVEDKLAQIRVTEEKEVA